MATSQYLILEAIKEKVEQTERFPDYHDVAEMRFSALATSGKTIPWDKMRHYLEQRIAKKPVKRPRAKKLI